MNNSKLTITLDFKGRDELEQIVAEIGKKHDIPVDIDISSAKLGILKDMNKSFKRPLNNTPAEPVRVNPCQFYAIFSRNLSFLPKFAIYSPQNASNLFIFSGNPEIWIDLSYLTIAK